MDKGTIQKAFNNQFEEFLEDVQSIFPDNKDISTTKSALLMLKKANPRMIITLWNSHVYLKYGAEIENDNIDYFLNKDYSDDLKNHLDAGVINKALKAIDNLRTPMRHTTDENKGICLQYLKNLNKLTQIYTSM
tara:strand:- start:1095 stop:1496 length:402 start_codon:yes stop_codon:yes gene_type:complete